MKQILLKTEGFYLQDNQREMHKADEELFFVIDEKNNQVELTEKGLNLISQNNGCMRISSPCLISLPRS